MSNSCSHDPDSVPRLTTACFFVASQCASNLTCPAQCDLSSRSSSRETLVDICCTDTYVIISVAHQATMFSILAQDQCEQVVLIKRVTKKYCQSLSSASNTLSTEAICLVGGLLRDSVTLTGYQLVSSDTVGTIDIILFLFFALRGI